MDERELLSGYASLLAELYQAEPYYERCHRYIEVARGTKRSRKIHSVRDIGSLARACWSVGVQSKQRGHFWRLLGHSLRRAPHTFARAVSRAIMGEHMLRYTAQDVLPRVHAGTVGLRRGAQRASTATRPAVGGSRPRGPHQRPFRVSARNKRRSGLG